MYPVLSALGCRPTVEKMGIKMIGQVMHVKIRGVELWQMQTGPEFMTCSKPIPCMSQFIPSVWVCCWF